MQIPRQLGNSFYILLFQSVSRPRSRMAGVARSSCKKNRRRIFGQTITCQWQAQICALERRRAVTRNPTPWLMTRSETQQVLTAEVDCHRARRKQASRQAAKPPRREDKPLPVTACGASLRLGVKSLSVPTLWSAWNRARCA